MSWTIRKAEKQDAEMLCSLAVHTYKQYFSYLWLDGGEAWYIKRTYAPETIEQELADPNNLHYIAYQDERPVGYLKIKVNSTHEGFGDRNCMELDRIYISKDTAGKGLGKKLINLCVTLAAEHQKDILFLKSMDSSTDSIAFYEKCGFEKCGGLTLPFPLMKPEYRGMYILKKDIRPD
jgi:ribosomal protein S18 acetylase RimI-like enzyme